MATALTARRRTVRSVAGSRRIVARAAATAGTLAAVLFILAPLLGVLGSSLTTSPFWEFPPRGLTLRWYDEFFSRPVLVDALFVSLAAAAFVGLVGTSCASLAAFGITRIRSRASDALKVATLVPILVPHLALGIAIYILYIENRVPINILTLGLAQLILALPLVIGMLVVALESIPRNVERAAANLGASPMQVALRVTLPLIRPALVAAAIIAFIQGFDDSTIALFVNSPSTVTLPVRMLVSAEVESGPLIAAGGSILMLIAVLLAVLLDATIGLERAFGIRREER